MTDPYVRTPKGMMDRFNQRLRSVEDRLVRVLPGRLQGPGQETANWNYVTEGGDYWSTTGAGNVPYPSTWQGHVTPGLDGRAIQSLTNRLAPGLTWKRARNAPDVASAYNSQPSAALQPLTTSLGWTEFQPRQSWARTLVGSGAPNGGSFARFTCPSSQDSAGRGWDAYFNLDSSATLVYRQDWLRRVWAGEEITVETWVRSSKALTMRIDARISDGGTVAGGGWLTAAVVGPNTAVPANTWTKISHTFTPTADGWVAFKIAAATGVALVSGDTIDGAQFAVRYAKGEWTEWRRSDNVLIPRRCIGGTAAAGVLRPFDPATGRYDLVTGDKYFAMDGIFTEEFRAYEILFQWFTGVVNGAGMRFRQNSIEIAPATGYAYQANYISGTGTPAGIQGTGSQASFPPNGAVGFNGKVWVGEPMFISGTANQKRTRSEWSSWGPTTQATVHAGLGSYDTSTLDGFSFYNSDQAPAGIQAGAFGWISVRGLV